MLINGLTINSLKAQGSWSLQTNPLGSGETAMIGKVQFVSATEGWISTSNSGDLLHTSNAGTTWSLVPTSDIDIVTSSSDPSGGLSFISPTTGWVMKMFGDINNPLGAVVYKTTDKGVTWQQQIISETIGDGGFQLQFFDANNGWASVINFPGSIKYYKTTNGGSNWNLISTDNSWKICHFIDTNNGWAIDPWFFNQSTSSKIYHTTNGGASWVMQYEDPLSMQYHAIQFTDINNGWVVGENGKILKTTDGGLSWIPFTIAGITTEYFNNCIYFMNAKTGWIGSRHNNTQESAKILHTNNGGTSWTIQDTNYPEGNIFSIYFGDDNNGWFTGDSGIIGHYTNPLEVKENIVNKYLNIFPNPNNGTFYFSLKDTNSKIQVEIFNISGQKVYEASNMEKQTTNKVNFSPQTKGVYLIKINDEENSYSEKIMIK
jgi:photosystem II stability/assembly factor-like uncharacterized protein